MLSRHPTAEVPDVATRLESAGRRSLLEANLDAVVILGANARVEDVNTALETLTGRTRHELVGTDAALYLSDPEAARHLYRDAVREGSVRDRPLEVRHRRLRLRRGVLEVREFGQRAYRISFVVL